MPTSCLLTGMYRSGTTLADHLLHESPDVFMATEPVPLLLIETKRRFLAALDRNDPYPLGHLFGEQDYGREDFTAFLDRLRWEQDDLRRVLAENTSYRGANTPEVADIVESVGGGSFVEVRRQVNERLAGVLAPRAVQFVGSKEVLGEEYLPYLAARGEQCIIVLRDPRAVVASLLGPGADRYGGRPRPLLYEVRTWRKSVAVALALRDLPNVHVLRYEDLVDAGPALPLELWSQLGLRDPGGAVPASKPDQDGRPWKGNSSHRNVPATSSESLARARELLDPETLAFIELCTDPELAALGYERGQEPTHESFGSMTAFREPAAMTRQYPPRDYSVRPEAAIGERRRWELLRADEVTESEQERWFVLPEAYRSLRIALERR